ncbi:PREDICTED: BEN domain-containing protein 2 [Propithecus coquereli]|uniref:BEN domain-containing protein 2 n=1 Tax=Propithecus coquereli TaxID=379532 RepID=UPI00063FB0FE|nr:PREDICTED: BEN domain-containing protein 2 [Propithecus coquereli]
MPLEPKTRLSTQGRQQSRGEDFIVVTIEDDSDGGSNDDHYVTAEASDREVTQDAFLTDDLVTIQTDFQDSSGNIEVSSQVSNEHEGLVPEMNCTANLKRYGPNSVEEVFIPLHKKRRSSTLRENAMENCNTSLLVETQEAHTGANPAGTSLQSAACPESQQPDPRENPSLPSIVSTHSLCLHLSAPSDSSNKGAENANGVIRSAQATTTVPIPVLPQVQPSLPNNPDMRNYSVLVEKENMDPHVTSLSFCKLPNFAMPEKAETILENSTETMNYPASLGNHSGQDTASSSHSIPPNFDKPKVAEASLENNSETRNYQNFLENDSGHYSSSSSVYPPTNFEVEKFIFIEIPGQEEGNSQTMYYPALLGNMRGPGTATSSLPGTSNFVLEKVILLETRGKAAETSQEMPGNAAETSQGNNSQTTVSGNDSGQDAASSSASIPPYCALENVLYIEMLLKTESSPEKHSETVNYPTSVENANGQDNDSASVFLTPVLLLIKILIKAETSMENSSDTINCPTFLKNDSGPDSSSSSVCIPPNYGYLGDPKRNVTMLNTHLATAQQKAAPKNAARYLVRNLFSREILMCSSVGANSQGRQCLDPNKMAALREYLAGIFPNYDLSELGKDWKECMSYIRSLIRYVCSETKRTQQKTVGKNKGPTEPGAPASADLNGEGGSVGSEGSSSLPLHTSASDTRENGASQQPSNAIPEEMKTPSTGNSIAPQEALNYFGNPQRNIQMPYSVLNIAKRKTRPELSARYLIRKLFTEDVLVKSNVYGSLRHGVSALNSNTINALREFLQDVYPTYDLAETGRDWKLCVSAINSCIRSIRYGRENSPAESQQLSAATPSAESKPEDTASTN